MSSAAPTSPFRRSLYSLLALALLVAGGITYVAPSQPAAAAGAPIVIDDFSGNRLGTRTVTNHPQRDSTTPAGSFTESDGVGVVVARGNGNSAAYTTLEYNLAGATDLTAGGNNKQFFLEFNSIQRTPLPGPLEADTAMIVGVNLVDSAGRTGNFSTGITNTLGQNIVLNWECSGGVCFSGNADYTKITKVTVTVSYPTNYDYTRTLRAELNIIRTTPLGGIQPPATAPYVAPVKSTVESTTAAPVEFVVAFTAWGSARSVSGLDASDFIVSGTATPLGTPVVTGGPSEYLVTIPGVATSGTVRLEAKPGAVTDTWGQPSLAGSGPATSTFVLGVAPVITSGLAGTAVVGDAFSTTFTYTGNPAPVYTRTSGTLPTGITLSSTGVLSGTPAAGSAGTYSFAVKATNFAGSDTKTFVLTVRQKPGFTSGTTAAFTRGMAGSFTVTTTGSPTAAITRTGTLPPGITFTDNGDGTATIAGTPSSAASGTFPLSMTAANGVNPNAVQTLTIVVNVAPTVTTDPASATVLLGETATFTASGSGYPAPTVQWQLRDGTTWSNIAGATSTTYAFVPTQADHGRAVRAVFTNSTSTATSGVAGITVKKAPTITSDATTTFVVGDAGSFVVTADGIPAPTITHGTLPTWLAATTNPNGSVTFAGTPPVSAAGANVVVDLTATNGVSPVSIGTLTIVVRQKPVVTTNPQGLTVEPGTAVSLTAAASGFPLPSVQWQRSTDGGANFSTVPGETQPTLAFTSVVGGNGDRYRAVFTNAVGSTTTAAAIVRVGTAPTFTSAASTRWVAGVANTFTVTTLQSPTISLPVRPTWLTLTQTGPNTATLSGTPPLTSKGVHSFSLSATNGFDPDASQGFSLTVDAAPVITSAASTTFTVAEASTFVVSTTAGFPTATGLSVLGDLPSGVIFADNGNGTGTFSGTAVAGTGGTYPVTVRALAVGGSLGATTQAVLITVNEQAAFTSADSVILTAGDAASVTITTKAGFPVARAITRSGALPSGLSFTDNGDGTATIAGTPAVASAGRYVLTLTADNGVDTAPTQEFTLDVHTRPVFTSADAVTFEVDSAESFTVRATAGFPVATSLVASGELPDGVTFVDNGDGTAHLAGTPVEGTGGTYALTVTALAVGGSLTAAQQALTLTVEEQPAFTGADSATLRAGDAATITITTAAGFPVARTLSLVGTLPSGMTFTDLGDGTATIAGTPAVASAGRFDLEITVDNGVGTPQVLEFALRVNTPATFTTAATATFVAGEADSFAVGTAAGFPVQRTITATGALPDGVTLVDKGDGTAEIGGTPATGEGGSYPLTIAAQTVGGTTAASTQSFTLVVVETATISSADRVTFLRDALSGFTVTTAHGFPGIPSLSATGSLPDGVTFVDNGDGTAGLAGTPTETGSYPLRVTSDNGRIDTQSFVLTVNTSPVLTSDPDSAFTVGVSGSFDIEATPGNPSTTVLTASALPDGLVFTDNGDGTATLAGAPAIGTAGVHPVTFTASNGILPDSVLTGEITITAAAAVALPATVPASDGALGGVPRKTTVKQQLTITGSGYAPGAPITIGMYSTPTALGTAIADSNGTFSARITLPALTGTHTLVASGVAGSGASQFLMAVTAVSPAASLVVTGTGGVEQALWLALLLLVTGFGLRSWGRARRAYA